MQLLSSASSIAQKPGIELSLNASRRTFGAHPPSIPCTTARHNLATSFTRALLATHIHHAHSSKRHHARLNMRPSVLCIRSTMSNSQRTKSTIRRSSSHVLNFSSFSRGQETGGAERDRTDDLLLAKQALSQLSYGPNPVGPSHPARPSPRTQSGGPGKI